MYNTDYNRLVIIDVVPFSTNGMVYNFKTFMKF